MRSARLFPTSSATSSTDAEAMRATLPNRSSSLCSVFSPTPLIADRTDCTWALLRRLRWKVMPKRCASSRICCRTFNAGEFRSINRGYGSPTLYTSSIRSASAIRVTLSMIPSSQRASYANDNWPLPPSITMSCGKSSGLSVSIREYLLFTASFIVA